MIESGSYKRFDALVVVHCDPEAQIERLMARDGLAREEALRRIAAQMPQREKLSYADYAVDTSGSLDETLARTRELWTELKRRNTETEVRPT
jgi:dephospho-CoA kinase